jgi:predicted MFS family arabinose efflux permease
MSAPFPALDLHIDVNVYGTDMTSSPATVSSPPSTRSPWTQLAILGVVLFASVSTELLPPALILGMSATLHVEPAAIGTLVTVWAGTIVVGTVPAIRLTRRIDRKRLLVGSLLVFAAATLVVALVPVFAVVVAARMVSAVAAAVSWSVVFAFVPVLAAPERLGRAMAVVLGGGTLASVIGVPLGAALAAAGGWPWAFAGAAVLLAASAAVLARRLPHVPAEQDAGPARRGADRTALPVGALLSAGALLLTAYMAVFAFIVPVLGGAGIAPGSAAALLLAAGVAGAVALALGGAVGDRFPTATLLVLVAAIPTGSAMLAVAPGAVAPSALAVAGVTALGFGIGGLPPVFQARIARTASPGLREFAMSLFVVVLNIGIAAGSALGAMLAGSAGTRVLPVLSTALGAAALVAFAVILALTSTSRRRSR